MIPTVLVGGLVMMVDACGGAVKNVFSRGNLWEVTASFRRVGLGLGELVEGDDFGDVLVKGEGPGGRGAPGEKAG